MLEWKIILAFVTGLIIFIYAIEHFSREIIAASGERFRKILSKLTKNRFTSTLLGTSITGLIQSSAATTVITVSLVSAGMISFAQSLGIIFGANIGTTITAQLIALKFTAFAPYFIIVGFLWSVFGKSYRYIGNGLFYFGLVFFGLDLVSDAIEPIKNNPWIIANFAKLSSIYIAFLVGFLFTTVVQSSSVTTGLVVILAANGLMSLVQAIPLLLGANIASTLPTLFVSRKLNLYAKRAAAAHLLFNFAGAIIFLPLIKPFANLIMTLGGSTAQQVANAHTIFNVIAAIIFLIILKPFQKLIKTLVPGEDEEILLKPKYLNDKLPKSNKVAFNLIEKELAYSLDATYNMYEKAMANLKSPSDKLTNEAEKYESLSDLLDEKIEKSLLEISSRKLSDVEAKRVVLLVRLSNAIEQLSDFAEDISLLPKTEPYSQESLLGIDEIYIKFRDWFDIIRSNFIYKGKHKNKRISKSLWVAIDKGYAGHIKVIKEKTIYSGSLFVESVSLLEGAINKLKEIEELDAKYDKIKK
jgi:phosphate:Na+ symporter